MELRNIQRNVRKRTLRRIDNKKRLLGFLLVKLQRKSSGGEFLFTLKLGGKRQREEFSFNIIDTYFSTRKKISKAPSLSDCENDFDGIRPKYKKKKKSKIRKFKRSARAVIAVRKMLRAKYRKRKMRNFSRSLYTGLCFQLSDLGNDSGYDTAPIKKSKTFTGIQILM